MTRLDCSVTSCTHNAENCCCKGTIVVDGEHAADVCDTCCGSFDKRSDDSYHNRFETPDTEVKVECEAVKCVYNENRYCTAEHIGIAGDGASLPSQTECATFRAR